MENKKRNLKGYKVKDSSYTKAKKRAVKEGSSLAKLIECVVTAYAGGFDIKAVWNKEGENKILTLDEVVAAYKLKS